MGDRASYLAYRGAAALANALPERVAMPIAAGAGRALAPFLSRRRRLVARNLGRVTSGGLQGLELQRAVSDTFASYGRYWLELFRLPRDAQQSVEPRFDAIGWEHIEAALAGGNGLILALPHLGGFDFAAAWLAGRGVAPTVVVEPVEPVELFTWFAQVREAIGMQVVPLGPDAGAAVLRALKANRIVCLLCDRDLAGDGVPVDFFGEATTMPGGPATLALRSGAPLVPAGVYFRPRGGHFAKIGPPVPVQREGRLRDDVTRVTQELAHRFEELIRMAPEQWHLMQPNWPSDRDT
ncbi:MAG: phosphatidylinositol mannoside acyltransferase [Acidimicrobiia bacterium]